MSEPRKKLWVLFNAVGCPFGVSEDKSSADANAKSGCTVVEYVPAAAQQREGEPFGWFCFSLGSGSGIFTMVVDHAKEQKAAGMTVIPLYRSAAPPPPPERAP